jgi:hypothetical protein
VKVKRSGKAFLAVFVVLVAGLLPWTAAAHPHREIARSTEGERPSPAGALDQAMGFLALLWAKIGCTIDPDGRCIPAQRNRLLRKGRSVANSTPTASALRA